MAEFQVLHQEPRHRVERFSDEVKERRLSTIQMMRSALVKLIAALCDQFDQIKQDAPQIKLDGIVFAETKWAKDGQLVIELGYDPQKDHDFGPRYHVDELVREVLTTDSRVAPLFDEVSQWFSALLDQFVTLKKTYPHLDLAAITFDDMRWLDRNLIFDIRLHGKPFLPREARWE